LALIMPVVLIVIYGLYSILNVMLYKNRVSEIISNMLLSTPYSHGISASNTVNGDNLSAMFGVINSLMVSMNDNIVVQDSMEMSVQYIHTCNCASDATQICRFMVWNLSFSVDGAEQESTAEDAEIQYTVNTSVDVGTGLEQISLENLTASPGLQDSSNGLLHYEIAYRYRPVSYSMFISGISEIRDQATVEWSNASSTNLLFNNEMYDIADIASLCVAIDADIKIFDDNELQLFHITDPTDDPTDDPTGPVSPVETFYIRNDKVVRCLDDVCSAVSGSKTSRFANGTVVNCMGGYCLPAGSWSNYDSTDAQVSSWMTL